MLAAEQGDVLKPPGCTVRKGQTYIVFVTMQNNNPSRSTGAGSSPTPGSRKGGLGGPGAQRPGPGGSSRALRRPTSSWATEQLPVWPHRGPCPHYPSPSPVPRPSGPPAPGTPARPRLGCAATGLLAASEIFRAGRRPPLAGPRAGTFQRTTLPLGRPRVPGTPGGPVRSAPTAPAQRDHPFSARQGLPRAASPLPWGWFPRQAGACVSDATAPPPPLCPAWSTIPPAGPPPCLWPAYPRATPGHTEERPPPREAAPDSVTRSSSPSQRPLSQDQGRPPLPLPGGWGGPAPLSGVELGPCLSAELRALRGDGSQASLGKMREMAVRFWGNGGVREPDSQTG